MAKASGNTNSQIIAAMSMTIQSQINKGVYISIHLQGRAIDVRTDGLNRTEFEKALMCVAHRNHIYEGDHYHVAF